MTSILALPFPGVEAGGLVTGLFLLGDISDTS